MLTDRARRALITGGSVLLSVALLWWALRDTSLAAVWDRVTGADIGLLTLAVGIGFLSLPLRAIRWKDSVTHLKPDVRTIDMYHSTAIGAMANNVLPARMGELVGSAACSRLTGIPLAASGASLVMVHVLDALVIGGLGAVALLTYPPDRLFGSAETVQRIVTVGLVVSGAVLAVLAVLSARGPGRLPESSSGIVRNLIHTGIAGLGALRDASVSLRVGAWTLVLWVGTGLAWWAGLRSFGLDIDFRAALVAQTVVALGIALPSAPGFFGPFESGARIALSLFIADSVAGAEAAVGFHIVVFFIPMIAAGLFSLGVADLSFSQLVKIRQPEEGEGASHRPNSAPAHKLRE